MKENVLTALVLISLILSIIAFTIEIKNEITDIEPNKIKGTAWTSLNDGSESGLDADKLDGYNNEQFLRSDVSDTIIGNLDIEGSNTVSDTLAVGGDTTISGNLDVLGEITHKKEIRYYTVNACEFMPSSDTDKYFLQRMSIMNKDFDEQTYYASFHLPENAIINKYYISYQREDEISKAHITIYSHGTPCNDDIRKGKLFYTEDLPLRSINENEPYESRTINCTICNYAFPLYIEFKMDPNDDLEDVQIGWVTIEYFVTS